MCAEDVKQVILEKDDLIKKISAEKTALKDQLKCEQAAKEASFKKNYSKTIAEKWRSSGAKKKKPTKWTKR